MDNLTLEQFVDTYLGFIIANHPEINNNTDIARYAKENIINTIKEQIIEENKDDIINEARKTFELDKMEESLGKTKKIIIETAFLGILVGLFVNQLTEILDCYFKDVKTGNLAGTWIITAVLFVLITILGVVMFTEEVMPIIKEIINKRKEVKNNIYT
ncbi:MAG: hypothetical protein ACI38A_08030 [Candidatus Ornithomonoglobus sp.]